MQKRIKSAGLIAMRSVAPNTSTKVLVTKLGGCGPARLGKRNADLVAMDREAMRCIRDRAPMTPYRYTRHGLLRTVADLYGEITSDFFSALIRETGSVFGSRYDREFAHSVRSKRT